MTTPVDNLLLEQLSAYMDGELPEAEARFLQRRLEHDAELRGQWMRLHLAANCLKNQAWQPMDGRLCQQVAAGTADGHPVRRPRPLLRWAMAASVAALAVLFAPRLMHNADSLDNARVVARTAPAATAPEHILASPASADLVAVRPTATVVATPAASGAPAMPGNGSDLLAANAPAPARESPMPLEAQSPSDFPLVTSGDKRGWPKSELLGAGSDPALEAYLVRHNQMLANDGLGGFVPYVDVVARDQSGMAPPADAASGDAGADQQ